MKLSVWAKKEGINYQTAWRWWKAGKMPVPAEQTASGTILVKTIQETSEAQPLHAVIYARVSSQDHKKDLDAQVGRLAAHAALHGLVVSQIVTEISSGMNGHCPKLISILHSQTPVLLVEHRDRFMRFGFEYVEAALYAQNRTIVFLDTTETTDDIVRDLHEIIVSLCARLYGKRSAKNRAQKALKALTDADQTQ